jgi:Killing trait
VHCRADIVRTIRITQENTMAFPTSVNDQITDAVTQANVKVIGEAPAIAMGTLYQALANSAGILYQNAVAAQQQQNTLAIAAVSEGIVHIYSADTSVDAIATAQTSTHADALQTQTVQASAALASAATTTAAQINPQIEAAVKLANEGALENAGRFAYALRASADAMSAALDETSKVTQANLMRLLQTAATAACLEAMLRHPEKAEDYQKVLETIKRLA